MWLGGVWVLGDEGKPLRGVAVDTDVRRTPGLKARDRLAFVPNKDNGVKACFVYFYSRLVFRLPPTFTGAAAG